MNLAEVPNARSAAVHILEPGGWGGIYQQSAAIASSLHGVGVPVVLHTARDPEFEPDAPWCGCTDWFRGQRFQRARVVISYLIRTLPHLRRHGRGSAAIHVQGQFMPMMAAMAVGALPGSDTIAFSPHNTFVRSGGWLHRRILDRALRTADVRIVFSESDRSQLMNASYDSVVAPFALPAPTPPPEAVRRWRTTFGDDGRSQVLLLAGQIRADKRPELLVEAASLIKGTTVALVGKDAGGLRAAQKAAEQLGVRLLAFPTFVPLEELAAAIAASDVVVAPYAIASNSGPLAFAAELGIPTVCTPIGGLPEVASVTATSSSAADLARAIREALLLPERELEPEAAAAQRQQIADAYRRCYRLETRFPPTLDRST